MKRLRKGMKLIFKTSNSRTEIIEKASNNPYTGMIKTDKNEYSYHFVSTWVGFGWIEIK